MPCSSRSGGLTFAWKYSCFLLSKTCSVFALRDFHLFFKLNSLIHRPIPDRNYIWERKLYSSTWLRGAMVARLTPDQKAACSNHVGVNNPFGGLDLLFVHTLVEIWHRITVHVQFSSTGPRLSVWVSVIEKTKICFASFTALSGQTNVRMIF